MWLILLLVVNVTWNAVSDAKYIKMLHRDDLMITGDPNSGVLLTKREKSEVQPSAWFNYNTGPEIKPNTESNGSQDSSQANDTKQEPYNGKTIEGHQEMPASSQAYNKTQQPYFNNTMEGQQEMPASFTGKPDAVHQRSTTSKQTQSTNTNENYDTPGKETSMVNQLQSSAFKQGGQLNDKTHTFSEGNALSTGKDTETNGNQSPAQTQTNQKENDKEWTGKGSHVQKEPSSNTVGPSDQESPKGDQNGNQESKEPPEPDEGGPVPAIDLNKGRPTGGEDYGPSNSEVFPGPTEPNYPSEPYDPNEAMPGINELAPDEGMGTGYEDMSMSKAYTGKRLSDKLAENEDEATSGDDV